MVFSIPRRLHQMKVFTIQALAELQDCSIRTAWRRLRMLGAFTSYNQNAKYHTLQTTPRFDEYGIWRYNDIGFSRYGNLTQTVAHLVGESPEGMDAQALCCLLGVSAHSLYTHFRGIREISAQRIGRRLVFFSSRRDIRRRQMAQRTEGSCASAGFLPRSTDAVLILVDRMKHPGDSIEQCVRRLRRQSAVITPRAVRMLLSHYGIVKKTADMR